MDIICTMGELLGKIKEAYLKGGGNRVKGLSPLQGWWGQSPHGLWR